MHRSIALIVFLKNLSTGILVSVLSLAMLQHGATIRTISLLIGLYSFTVLLAEFPSGVFADLCGRKTSFLLSAALGLSSYLVFLVSSSVGVLCVAIVLNGLGRAFASGSLDALAIDQIAEHGKTLEWVTSRLAILESVGLAAGALLGGFLSGLGSRYLGNLAANAVLHALLFVLTLAFVREAPREAPAVRPTSAVSAFLRQTKGSLAFLAQHGVIPALFVLALATGFALSSVETYWQPALAAMRPAYWMFGAVSFAGFGFVVFGIWAAERLLARFPARGAALLFAFKALLGVVVGLLFGQKGQASFIGVYLAAYVLVGGGGVAESTLLNRLAPSSHRAGILSLASFVLQLGGLLAALCGYWVSANGRYQVIWLVSAAFLVLCSAVCAGAQQLAPAARAADMELEESR